MSKLSTLIEQYLAGPSELRAAVKGMTREQLVARPVAGKMSTLEVVCHLVDFDPVYAQRMKCVIAEDNPTLLGADELAASGPSCCVWSPKESGLTVKAGSELTPCGRSRIDPCPGWCQSARRREGRAPRGEA